MANEIALEKIPFANHEEWLAIRKNYIGGSDAGAIAGMNPYSSPYAVWAEKTGKIPAFEGNVITKVGSYLEQLVADMFCEETGKKVRKNNFTLVNKAYPWACANLDREVVGESAILECKTTNSYVNVKKIHGHDFPDQWYCQMMHYLAVTGKQRAYLAVISESREFHWFKLERDEEEIASLMKTEQEFWEHVKNGTPPQIDGTDPTSETIDKMYPNTNGEKIELYGYESLLESRKRLSEQKKAIEEQIELIENQIKTTMKDTPKASCGAFNVSWALQSRFYVDTEKVKKLGVIPEYVYKKDMRVFRVTEKKVKA